MHARTEGAIALTPTGNTHGSILFYMLSSGKITSRQQFVILPTPTEVVEHMNSLAASEKALIKEDTDFKRSLLTVSEIHSEIEPIPDQTHASSTSDINSASPQPAVQIIDQNDDYGSAGEVVEENNSADAGDTVVGDTVQDQVYEQVGEINIGNGYDMSENDINMNLEENNVTSMDINTEDNDLPGQESSETLSADVQQCPNSTERRYPHRTNRTTWRDKLERGYVMQTWEYLFTTQLSKALKVRGVQAYDAAYREMSSLVDKRVFHPINISDVPPGTKIINSFMFLVDKFKADGTYDKTKARTVGNGAQQDKELYEEKSSPTCRLTNLHTVLCIASIERRYVRTGDVGTAYLNAEVGPRRVFMRLDSLQASILCHIKPEWKKYLCKNGSMHVEVDKALYGLIDSGRQWYIELTTTLQEDGFIANEYDSCIWNKSVRGIQISVCIYVDDLFITCVDVKLMDQFTKLLIDKYDKFTVVDGPKQNYLGTQYDFTIPGKIMMNMPGYVSDLLDHFAENFPFPVTHIFRSSKSPAVEEIFLPGDSPELSEGGKKFFHTIVAKWLYLANRCRPT